MNQKTKISLRQTALPDVVEITPTLFNDERGFVLESYHADEFRACGIPDVFVQDAESYSHTKGILRGLHYQREPYGQGKLAHVSHGAVLDVVVDIRQSSPTFGSWTSVVLDAKRRNMLWVPHGHAHGILILEDQTSFHYKFTDYYRAEHQEGILWNDPTLNIDWQLEKFGISKPLLSGKDADLPPFTSAKLLD